LCGGEIGSRGACGGTGDQREHAGPLETGSAEVADLRETNEILKKAMAVFTERKPRQSMSRLILSIKSSIDCLTRESMPYGSLIGRKGQ